MYSKPFECFWAAYPRKTAKGRAWKVWKRDGIDSFLEPILTSIAVYKQTEQWQKDNHQFVPHPATYLNDRRWDDSPDVTSKSARCETCKRGLTEPESIEAGKCFECREGGE